MSVTPPFAALFDMDGVISSNNAWHVLAWESFCARYATMLSAEQMQNMFGKTNEQILEWLFGPMDKGRAADLAEEKEEIFRKLYRPHYQLVPGLASWLAQLQAAGIPMVLATNATLSNINFNLDEGRIRHYFKGYVHPGLVALPKPAPDIYLMAAQIAGLPPARCVVFEDSYTGIAAGLAAGCQVVAISTTYPADELAKRAARVVPDFSTLTLTEMEALVTFQA
jgi:beta-phosphoglucomutase